MPFPARKLLAGKVVCYAAGLLVANAVLCAGILISGKISGTVTWIWPPSVPVRLMCPVLGIMPNGIIAYPGNPLLNSGVILPGVIISFVWFVLFSFLMVVCFKKKVVEE